MKRSLWLSALLIPLALVYFSCNKTDKGSTEVPAPDAPTGLHVTVTTTTSIHLAWTDNSDNEEHFVIERAPESGGAFAEIGIVNPNTVSFTDQNLTSNTTFQYRVWAENSGGNSDYSNVVVVETINNIAPLIPSQPSPPNQLANIPLNVTLAWTSSDPDQGSVLSYNVYFGDSDPPSLVSNQSDTSYSVTNLTANHQYFWKVAAKDNHNLVTEGPVWNFTTGGGGASIVVASPNGGERLLIGVPYDISWFSSGIIGDVQILLSRDGGNNWPETIASSTTNNGHYSWTPSGNTSSQSRVRISSVNDAQIVDASDGNAEIDYAWRPVSEIQGSLGLGVDFIDAQNGWIKVEELYHTTNGGQSWTHSILGTGGVSGTVKFLDLMHGWDINIQQIFYTTNGGVNWNPTNPIGVGNWYGVNVDFYDLQYGVAVGTIGNAFITTNGGVDWTAGGTPPEATILQGCAMVSSSVAFICGKGTGTGLNYAHVWKTTNGGVSWNSVLTQDYSDLHRLYFVNAQEGWVVGDNTVILHTIDGGSHWTPQTPFSGATLFAVKFFDENIGWAIGNGGTVLYTNNGGITWTVQHTGVTALLRSLDFVDDQNVWIAGDDGVTLHATHGGH